MNLSQTNEGEIINYLQSLDLLHGVKKIKIESGGEGNMNLVLRVMYDNGSIILKQSKHYVNKYPQIQAPIERIYAEYLFYNNTSQYLGEYMPKVLSFDRLNYILILEDLGASSDFLAVYKSPNILDYKHKLALNTYLETLHGINDSITIENQGMKVLNHEHIFNFPFLETNNLDLENIQTGLKSLSLKYKKNKALIDTIKGLGKKYLCIGNTLVHGDFYPGSWLLTSDNLKVIDPEFCFIGDAEFDFGIMNAHMLLAGIETENSNKLCDQYTGVEILRRIFGIAQLPLSISLEKKESICDAAVKMLL